MRTRTVLLARIREDRPSLQARIVASHNLALEYCHLQVAHHC